MQEIVEIESNERKSVVRKVPKETTRKRQSWTGHIEQGTLHPPSQWNKNSFFYKNPGIQSRNDNFAFGTAPIFQHADPFQPSVVRYLGDSNSGERISSTLRTSVATTPKAPTTLYVWDGKTMPKNHKMAWIVNCNTNPQCCCTIRPYEIHIANACNFCKMLAETQYGLYMPFACCVSESYFGTRNKIADIPWIFDS